MFREYYSQECFSGGRWGGGAIFWDHWSFSWCLWGSLILLVHPRQGECDDRCHLPAFFSLVITLLAISHCCLPSVLWVSILLSTLLIPIFRPWVSSLFLSVLIPSILVLKNDIDAVMRHFLSADFDPSSMKKIKCWLIISPQWPSLGSPNMLSFCTTMIQNKTPPHAIYWYIFLTKFRWKDY